MKNPVHFSPRLRRVCLYSFVALSILAGCGNKISGDTQTPAEPANPHSVTIRWAASKSAVAGYNVYRLSKSGEPVRLTHGIITSTEFVDRTVEAGQTYAYYVTSVDSRGNESSPSNKIMATVPKTVTPPAKQQ